MDANRTEKRRCARATTFVFSLLAGWTLTAAPAVAHSDLESSTPATNSVVAEMVDEIEFVFVSSVQPESAEVAVVVDGEPVVAASAAGSSQRALVVRPGEPILAGEVAVAVALLAADGHRIEVGIRFSVDARIVEEPPTEAAPVAPSSSTSTSTTATTSTTTATTTTVVAAGGPGDPADGDQLAAAFGALHDGATDRLEQAQAVVRGIGYAATVLVVGLFVFGRVIDRSSVPAARDVVAAGAAVALVLVTLAWVSTQAALHAGGDTAALFDVSAWDAALEGRLAIGFWLRLLGAALLLAAALGTGRHAVVGGAVGATAVVFTYGLIGHNSVAFASLAAVVHVTALSIWIGGLFGLVRVLRQNPSRRGALLSRFSRLAAGTLVVTVAAGVGLAVSRLGAPSELWATSYGRILVAKVLVFAVVVALGASNRLAITRDRDLTTSSTLQRLRRVGVWELGTASLVIVLTTTLVASG